MRQANNWLDEQTRAVIIQFNVFNPNFNVYCAVQLIMEYLPCGKVLTSARYDGLKLSMYETTADKLYGILDAVLVILLGYFIFQQVGSAQSVHDMLPLVCYPSCPAVLYLHGFSLHGFSLQCWLCL